MLWLPIGIAVFMKRVQIMELRTIGNGTVIP